MPEVVFLQKSPKSKEPLLVSPSLTLVEGLGIDGDHHARPRSSRQVLLMAVENCDAFGLSPGEVRENIVTRGLDLQNLPAGTLLAIRGTVLQITKDCEPCSFIEGIRPGLRARMERRRGMLARVLRGGEIRIGDEIRVTETAGP
ncbi:MAG TPA: MOSC domain-containing protein [Planctomycetota bacterium]|nr:MOSC domain-containing protein [Planctomycetota bacterium]